MSKYKIFDIRKSKPGNRLYFFDANVWLLILDRPIEPTIEQQAYINFWDVLTHPDRNGDKVIVANALLISEVLNRFLRIRFAIYKEEQIKTKARPKEEIEKLDFKKDYRGSKSYKISLLEFTSEFTAYETYIEIVSDKAEEVRVMELLNSMSSDADFNDIYYYQFCKLQGFPIVTHDGDFAFRDHPILTCNKKLLEYSNLGS